MSCKQEPLKPKWSPNGCGPKEASSWLGRKMMWLVNKLVLELIFHDICDCHDWGYQVGAVKSIHPEARQDIDDEFYFEMHSKANTKSGIKKYFYLSAAKTYYSFVVRFGDKHFNWFSSMGEWEIHLEKLGFSPSERMFLKVGRK